MLTHLIWMYGIGFAIYMLGTLRYDKPNHKANVTIGVAVMSIITAFASLIFLLFIPRLHRGYETGGPEMLAYLAMMLITGVTILMTAYLHKKVNRRRTAIIGGAFTSVALIFAGFLLYFGG